MTRRCESGGVPCPRTPQCAHDCHFDTADLQHGLGIEVPVGVFWVAAIVLMLVICVSGVALIYLAGSVLI